MHEFRLEHEISVIGEIECHDRRFGQIGGHEILLADLHQLFNALLADIFTRQLDKSRIDLEAHRFHAVFFCRRNDHPSVARTKVINNVAFLYCRDREHSLDDFLG